MSEMPIFYLNTGGRHTGQAASMLEGMLINVAVMMALDGSLTEVETFELDEFGIAGAIQMVLQHAVVGNFRGPVFKLTVEAGMDEDAVTEYSRYMVDGSIIREAERRRSEGLHVN